jgi:hypothetical protein
MPINYLKLTVSRSKIIFQILKFPPLALTTLLTYLFPNPVPRTQTGSQPHIRPSLQFLSPTNPEIHPPTTKPPPCPPPPHPT